MKTMPKTIMKVTRFGIEALLGAVQRWEDRNADPTDYRTGELLTGLWQASQALKTMIQGDFDPHRKRTHVAASLACGKEQRLTDRYADELVRTLPFRLRKVRR